MPRVTTFAVNRCQQQANIKEAFAYNICCTCLLRTTFAFVLPSAGQLAVARRMHRDSKSQTTYDEQTKTQEVPSALQNKTVYRNNSSDTLGAPRWLLPHVQNPVHRDNSGLALAWPIQRNLELKSPLI